MSSREPEGAQGNGDGWQTSMDTRAPGGSRGVARHGRGGLRETRETQGGGADLDGYARARRATDHGSNLLGGEMPPYEVGAVDARHHRRPCLPRKIQCFNRFAHENGRNRIPFTTVTTPSYVVFLFLRLHGFFMTVDLALRSIPYLVELALPGEAFDSSLPGFEPAISLPGFFRETPVITVAPGANPHQSPPPQFRNSCEVVLWPCDVP